MAKNMQFKRILAVLLSLVMLVGMLPAGALAAENGGRGFTVEKVDNAPRLLKPKNADILSSPAEPDYADTDDVRVSIVLEDVPTVSAGYSTKNIAGNAKAMSYRASLRSRQDRIAERISLEALRGRKLDVVWNLTLAANLISANVKYGDIEAIRKTSGVKDVVIETRYAPMVVRRDADNPNMGSASEMTGGTFAWAAGYTGAGSKIAVIDTGIDTEHQSFNEDAFLHALEETGKTVDLLEGAEVKAHWSELNIAERIQSDGSDAYLSAKIPFAANYVDSDFDVSHLNDKEGEHGSHVAGIAAANRFVKNGDSYENALESVLTQGEAPDAQIFVMKVFGKGGGAYDSDYMAAVEDAILLGADVVNLSLGSAVAGMVMSDTYQDIMEGLADTDVVWTNSAGNSGAFPQYANFSYIYGEDLNLATGGSPGTYGNTLSVASIDNKGYTGEYLTVGEDMIFYNQSTNYGNAPISTVAGEKGYILLDGLDGKFEEGIGIGTEEEFAALKDVLGGKIAICSRGKTSFFEKANAAVENGAIAVIIYNNTTGTIGLNLTGYEHSAPVVSVTMADGALLKAAAEEKTTKDGAVYYEGTLTVGKEIGLNNPGEVDSYTMSDFSSWGVPGDLSMKPEIAAPGGNIFSVWGANIGASTPTDKHDQYENMSGTSMAAPQVAGLTAVMAQYIRENDLLTKTGLSQRQLIQSLLMSTAEPLIDAESGMYYPVLQQGAGRADVNAAMNAGSFLTMDESATASAADGKVKVELGADEERAGTYTAKFTVTNMTDEEARYEFGADFFTQDYFAYYQYGADGNPVADEEGNPLVAYYLDSRTVPLAADLTWTVDGEEYLPETNLMYDFDGDGMVGNGDVQALLDYVTGVRESIENEENADLDEDGDRDTYDAYLLIAAIKDASVSVEPNGSIDVEVTFTLTDIADYDLNGAYIEGYLYVDEVDSEDGALGVSHSIPVLGYYGGWTEASMFDHGSYLDTVHNTTDLQPYMNAALGENAGLVKTFLVKHAGESGLNPLGGNPVFDDAEYHPERNAMNAADTLDSVRTTLIRNAGAGRVVVTDADGKEILASEFGNRYAAYTTFDSSSNSYVWKNTAQTEAIGLTPSGLADGTALTATLTYAPEYYIEDGKADWDALGDGASYSISWMIDSTAPEFGDIDVKYSLKAGKFTGLEVPVTDNAYIAAVALFDEEGNPLSVYGSELDTEAGETIVFDFPFAEIFGEEEPASHMLVQAYDYASNYVTFKINLTPEELENGIQSLTVDPTEAFVVAGNQVRLTAQGWPWGVSDEVSWSSADETIATVDENGIVTGISEGEVTITATSKENDSVTAEAIITVREVDMLLNGVVWDENGEVWFSEFNLKDLPDYTKLHDESMKLQITGTAYDGYGNFYAVTFDTDEWTSDLYLVDPETWEAEPVGSSNIGYMDIAPAPNLGENTLVAVYATYVVLVDKTNGQFIGVFDYKETTGGKNLVGVAYEASAIYEDEETPATPYDWYFFIDQDGNLYEDGFLALGENIYNFGPYDDEINLGYTSDTPYFSSLYLTEDEEGIESLYWSRFNEESTDIIVLEDFYGEKQIYRAGGFGSSVWPVGGLFEEGYERATVIDPDAPADGSRARADLRIGSAAETDLVPARPVKQANGGLNASAPAEAGTERPELPGTAVEIKAEEKTTNGKLEIEFETGAVLTDVKVNTDYFSVLEEEGKVTIGYVSETAVPADSVIATLTFELAPETVGAHVRMTTAERNEVNPYEGEAEISVLGEHIYGEPEWTWEEDGSAAKVAFSCEYGDDIQTPDVTVTSEVKIAATCTAKGTTAYTAAVTFGGKEYTSVKEIEDIEATGHTPGEPVKENVVEATWGADGSYDEVVYCTVCGEELSRETVVVPSLGIRGDMNNDGVVDSADAIYLLRHTMSATRYPITQPGDLNGDGAVDSADPIYLLRHTMSPTRYPLH